MDWKDLRRLLLSPSLFRLDTILAPRLVPLLYLAGLGALLLWAVDHLLWTFAFGFFNGLWGILEIVVFGLLWLLVIRIGAEAVAVYFKTHATAAGSINSERLPTPLLDDVVDAIRDLADDVDPPAEVVDPAPHIIRPGATTPPAGAPAANPPVVGPTVRRTAKRSTPKTNVDKPDVEI